MEPFRAAAPAGAHRAIGSGAREKKKSGHRSRCPLENRLIEKEAPNLSFS